MIVGVGVDIVEIERIAAALERPAFRARVFGDEERTYCESGGSPERVIERYAGRFAAKEAVVKALGCGFSVPLREIQTLCAESGAPYVQLSGVTEARLQGGRLHVSISHSQRYAVAQAIFERTEG